MRKRPVSAADIVAAAGELSDETRARVARALEPRKDRMVSNRFPSASVEAWRAAAERARLSLGVWMQQQLDAAATKR